MNDRVASIIGSLRSEFGNNCLQDKEQAWRFEVVTKAGRSQVVTLFVRDQVHGERDLSRFVAFSPVGPVFPGLPYDLILRKNSELDIGALAIEDVWTRDDIRLPYLVFRATHLVATADYPEIWELVVKTAEYADELEQSVYSRDLY